VANDLLELADWRRGVADLYAGVRSLASRDPEAAWEIWRRTRERLFREHSQSPVPAGERAGFQARHWPYDPTLRFEVALEDATAAETATLAPQAGGGALTFAPPALAMEVAPLLALPISTGGEESFTRIGRLTIPFPAGERSLGAYWMAGYAGGLFVPFRDATNGTETYGAGRYLLDTAKSADLGAGSGPDSLILDFNFAFHPSCAFDPKWSCPLAPPENRLDIRIEAGERLT
jgi:uncharacterized protein (DUF1684 family)